MKPHTLKTFQRWYNIVVTAVIAAFLIATLHNWGEPSSMLFGCFAVLAGAMLLVTNMIVKQLLPKEKSQFRNQKK